MSHLYEYAIMVRKMTRDQFIAAENHPFLLCERSPDSESDGWTFKTNSISSAAVRVSKEVAAEGFRLSPRVASSDVFAVVKGVDNPWPERISVGRARNNDIVLADSSVSKLHAHFRLAEDGGYGVADAGSRNGTLVNSRRLGVSEAALLKSGDTVVFGRVSVTFLDAGALFDLITSNLQER
ncbi:MAG: FHA domain-containing protein [Deltaproteobacteria bacterium]|nr:FHA domain-containing protein [Deltaproteobacteria bacterium]